MYGSSKRREAEKKRSVDQRTVRLKNIPCTSNCVLYLCACVLRRCDELNQLSINSIAKQRKTKTYKQTELRTGFEPVTWMCERPTTAHAFIRCPSGTARQVVRYKLCQNSGRDYMRNFELTLRRLMSHIYIYGAPILDVSRSHTTTQHSR